MSMRRGIIASRGGAPNPPPPTDNLRAHYIFNGDATDEQGVYNGIATSMTYGVNIGRQSAIFSGTGKIGVGNVLVANGDQSVSAWVNLDNIGGAVVVSRPTDNNRNMLYIAGSRAITAIKDGTNSGAVVDDPANVIDDSLWHHLVSTINRTTDELKLYVDKVLIGTSSITSVGSIPTDTYFGWYAFLNTYYTGYMADIRIYTDVLSLTEVRDIYNYER